MSGAEDVARAWVAQDRATMARGNVSFDGPKLTSYKTVIGVRYPHFVLLTDRYHSKSTRLHRAAAGAAVEAAGLLAIPVAVVLVDERTYGHKDNVDTLRRHLKTFKDGAKAYPEDEYYAGQAAIWQRRLDEYTLRFELEAA